MTTTQQELKELLDSLTPADRAKSRECADKLLAIIKEYDTLGVIALTIIGITFQTVFEEDDV